MVAQQQQILGEYALKPNEWLRVELTADGLELNLIPFAKDENGRRDPSIELSWYANYGWAANVTGRRRVADYFIAPISDDVVSAVLAWPPDRIEWQGELVKATLLARQKMLDVRRVCAKIVAEFKKTGAVPSAALALPDPPGLKLMPVQKLGAYLITLTNSWGVWFEQGVGKTATVITAVSELARKRDNPDRPLIVLGIVPPNLLLNWKREFKRFATASGVVCTLTGPPAKRTVEMLEAAAVAKQAKCDYVAYLISMDSVAGFANEINFLSNNIGVDFMYVDESHYIKDPKAKRSKVIVEQIAYSAPAYCRKVCLTGTPVNNTIRDLFMQLEFMEQGRSGFSSPTQFEEAYKTRTFKRNGKQSLAANVSALDKRLQETLALSTIMVRKEMVLKDLPPKSFSVRGIKLHEKQYRAYCMLRDQLMVEAAEELGMAASGNTLTANHILTKLLRLTQITTGFISWDPDTDEDGNPLGPRQIEYFDPNPKINELLTIADEMEDNEKAIIWCGHQPMYDEVIMAIQGLGKGIVEYTGRVGSREARNRAEDAFNRDRSIQFMLANQRSAGVGLNLLGYDKECPHLYETNCTKHINMNLTWSWAQRAQGMDRSHRQGTRVPLEIIDIVAENTIDEIILDVLEKKAALAEDVTSLDVSSVLDKLRSF